MFLFLILTAVYFHIQHEATELYQRCDLIISFFKISYRHGKFISVSYGGTPAPASAKGLFPTYIHFLLTLILSTAFSQAICSHEHTKAVALLMSLTRAITDLALFNSNSCWPVSPKPTLIQVSGDTWVSGPIFTTWSLQAFGPHLTHASGRQRTLT